MGELLQYLWVSCEEYSYIKENFETLEEALEAYKNGSCGLPQTILELNQSLFGTKAEELIQELY